MILPNQGLSCEGTMQCDLREGRSGIHLTNYENPMPFSFSIKMYLWIIDHLVTVMERKQKDKY